MDRRRHFESQRRSYRSCALIGCSTRSERSTFERAIPLRRSLPSVFLRPAGDKHLSPVRSIASAERNFAAAVIGRVLDLPCKPSSCGMSFRRTLGCLPFKHHPPRPSPPADLASHHRHRRRHRRIPADIVVVRIMSMIRSTPATKAIVSSGTPTAPKTSAIMMRPAPECPLRRPRRASRGSRSGNNRPSTNRPRKSARRTAWRGRDTSRCRSC